MPAGLSGVSAIAAGWRHTVAIAGLLTSVVENAGAQTLSNFLIGISPGPAGESAQTVSFTVTNSNNALFSVQPALAANGTLTFTPAPNTTGSATVTALARDNGGTANGGVDTSGPQTFTVTVNGIPPGISSQPTGLTVDVTSNAAFSVTGTGTAPLAYQWRKNGVNLVGETGATVGFVNVQTNHAGSYTVVITNTWGSVTSSVAALTVNRLSQTITFAALPGKRVDEGPFSLTASTSSGLPVTFSSSDAAVATVSGNTVTITGIGSTTITASQAGDATYLPASVNRTLAVAGIPAGISSQPTGLTVNVTSIAAFSVTGTGTAPLAYQWRKNGVNLVGETGATVGFVNVQTNHAGSYTVVITNTWGSVTSSVAALTVNRLSQTITFAALPGKRVDEGPFSLTASTSSGLPVTFSSSDAAVATVSGNTATVTGIGSTTITASQAGNAIYLPASVNRTLAVAGIPPSIVGQPTGQTVNVTGIAAFNVTAAGTAPFSYQWRREGVDLGGSTGATLGLVNVQTNQAGSYTVVITNTWGSITSSVAVLTVNQLSQTITFGALPLKRVDDAPFTLTATASSGLPVIFSSSDAAVATVSGNTVTLTGIGSTTLTASQAGDATYLPATSVNRTLSVAGIPPGISSQPASLTLNVTSNAAFSVTGTGTAPLAYQWRKNDADLVSETGAALGLVNVQTNQAGSYTVVITNMWGSVTSSVAALTVSRLVQAVTFAALPGKRVDDGPFSLAATTSSSLPVAFSSSDAAVATVSGDTVTITGIGSTTITAAQAGNATYLPATSVNRTLAVAGIPPGITSQPVGIAVNVTSNAAFSVTGTGTAPLAYQWRKNGVNLVGETGATVGFVNVQTNHAGSYTVVITNTWGSVTSSVAALTVNRLSQTITFAALPGKRVDEGPFSLTASTSSGLPVTFSSSDAAVATVSGNTATVTGIGSTTITASQAGNAIYLPASVNRTLAVAGIPPSIVGQPAGLAVAVGANPSLIVGSIGSGPLSYQWRLGTNGLAQGTNATLTLTNVQTSQAGVYTVVISNLTGSVTSSAAVLKVVPEFVTRSLPSGYTGGARFTVGLSAAPPTGTDNYALEDAIPAGWTVGAISHSGSFDGVNGKVKFGPFFDATARTLTYESIPPANASGTATFTGAASADGVNTAVLGAQTMEHYPRIPADNNPTDGRVTIGEVTAYGSAWKSGAIWATGPNPIPIGYVTRAGALWKGGETYRFDAAVTNAPLWWVNTSGMAPAALMAAALVPAAVTPGEAIADLAGGFQRNKDFVVTLRVRPSVGVQNYAVEETVPPGWNIRTNSLDQGGAYDGNGRKVKWGQFFDNQERVLSFILEPGASVDPVVFAGVASFDGVEIPFTGRRAIQRGAFLPENANAGRNVKVDGFRVVVQGEAGKRYDIEATETPGVLSSWLPVATNLDGTALVDFTDTLATSRQARFYRVIER